MNLQDIIVIAIVFICVLYVGRHIMNYFRAAQKGENPCAGCASGCDLKRLMDEKKRDRAKNNRKKKKKCCG